MAHITFPLDRTAQSSSGAGLCLSSFVSFMELSTDGYSELLSGNRDDPLKFKQIMLGFNFYSCSSSYLNIFGREALFASPFHIRKSFHPLSHCVVSFLPSASNLEHFLPYFVITSGIKETKDKTGETWLLGMCENVLNS